MSNHTAGIEAVVWLSSAHGGLPAVDARGGAPPEGGASRGAADPGRDGRAGRAHLRALAARRAPRPQRARGAPRLHARRTALLRLGAGLTYTEAMRGAARRAAAGARRGVPHRRLAADTQPRDDRRQSRHRVARGRRAAASSRRAGGGRARERARHADAAARGLPARRQADGSRAATSWSPRSACTRAVARRPSRRSARGTRW